MAFEYADERLRINSLRKNTILPKDLRVQFGILAWLFFLKIYTVIIVLLSCFFFVAIWSLNEFTKLFV